MHCRPPQPFQFVFVGVTIPDFAGYERVPILLSASVFMLILMNSIVNCFSPDGMKIFLFGTIGTIGGRNTTVGIS